MTSATIGVQSDSLQRTVDAGIRCRNESMGYKITAFDNIEHRDQAISLWKDAFGYETTHNAPDIVIDKNIDVNDGLFFVAVGDGQDGRGFTLPVC